MGQKTKTSFDSDNQPEDRKPRGKGRKSLMLEAIKSVCGTEQDFLNKVVAIGLGGWTQPEQKEDEEPVEPIFQNPNPMLLNMVLNRIEPPLKAIAPMVEFEFRKDAKPHEQANDIMDAVSKGVVPPDVGQMFVSSIKSMIEIEEYTDLKERIENIEKALGVSNAN